MNQGPCWWLLSMLLVLVTLSCERSSHRRDAYYEVVVRKETGVIEAAIVQYWIFNGHWPWSSAHYEATQTYSNLCGFPSSKIRYLPSHPRWDRARRLIDPWESDYHCRVMEKTNAVGKTVVELRICSPGRNRRDDNGLGDDILFTHVVP